MHAYIVLSLLTRGRTEELRELRWEHVHLEPTKAGDEKMGPYIEVWRSVRRGGDTKTRRSGERWRFLGAAWTRYAIAAPSRTVTGCLPEISGTIPVLSSRPS